MPHPAAPFLLHVNFTTQVFVLLDAKGDSSSRKLIHAARTLASEMSSKTGCSHLQHFRITFIFGDAMICSGEKVLMEAKALMKDIGTKGVASIMQDPGDVMRSIVQDRPLTFLKDHHARIDAIQRSIVRYVVELLPRLSLPVYTGVVPSSPVGELSLVLNNVRFSELQVRCGTAVSLSHRVTRTRSWKTMSSSALGCLTTTATP
jgi:hypothetical protein